jgi:hypothetical protein
MTGGTGDRMTGGSVGSFASARTLLPICETTWGGLFVPVGWPKKDPFNPGKASQIPNGLGLHSPNRRGGLRVALWVERMALGDREAPAPVALTSHPLSPREAGPSAYVKRNGADVPRPGAPRLHRFGLWAWQCRATSGNWIELERLYEPPFTTIHAESMDGVFQNPGDVDELLDILSVFEPKRGAPGGQPPVSRAS